MEVVREEEEEEEGEEEGSCCISYCKRSVVFVNKVEGKHGKLGWDHGKVQFLLYPLRRRNQNLVV